MAAARRGAPADEVVFDAMLGIAPWPSALLMFQSFSITGVGSASGAYRRFDIVKLQLSLAQAITENLWLQMGLIDAVAGTDAGAGGARRLVAILNRACSTNRESQRQGTTKCARMRVQVRKACFYLS